MQRLFLLVIWFCVYLPAVSQDRDDSFSKKWEQLLLENRYAELARLVRGEADRESDSSHRMLLVEAAHFYEIQAAPLARRMVLTRAALFDGAFSKGSKREWGVDLAEWYNAECQYDSARYILDFSLHIPERVQRCFATSDFPYRYRHQWMLALEGLGCTDSAIRVFAPVAFQSKEGLGVFQSKEQYAVMVADFVRVLNRYYSRGELVAAAEEMISSSGFRVDEATGFPKGRKHYTFVNRFLGGGYDSNLVIFPGDATAETEQKLREQLRRSVLYQLLTGAPLICAGM